MAQSPIGMRLKSASAPTLGIIGQRHAPALALALINPFPDQPPEVLLLFGAQCLDPLTERHGAVVADPAASAGSTQALLSTTSCCLCASLLWEESTRSDRIPPMS
jgi:hypothetical protein